MSYRFIDVQIDGALCTILLDRPQAFNALHEAMMDELLDASIMVATNQEIRALLLSGKGESFCGGGDVKSFVEAGDTLQAMMHRMTIGFHGMASRLVRMEKPVVTAINGVAAGGGLSLANMGDIVLASEKARFTSAYTRIGASPDGSSTFFLARAVGLRRALELVLTNRVLDAHEAVEWGLATRVLPHEGFMAAARQVAEELAQGPTLAFGRCKDLLYHSVNRDLEAQMERETQHIVAASRSEDFREATRAFVEKRKPVYRGR